VVHGGDSKVRYANPVALTMLGLSEEQIVGKAAVDPFWHFVRADGSVMPQEEFPVNRVVADRQTLRDYTVGIVHSRDEEPLWAAVSAFPELDEKGELDQVLVCFLDITARKHYEQALERDAQEWTQAMDVFPDIIYLLDTQRRLIRANKMFYAATKTDPGRALGQHIVKLMHAPGEEENCPVCRAQEELRDATLTMEADHPANSTQHPIEVTMKVIRGPSGAPHALLTTIHDLTNARRFEDQLRHLNESLEHRVQEEVAKNREKDIMLIQQSRLATMGEMMHNVAHQWRQPLATVSLILSNIKDDYEFGELTGESLDIQVANGLRLAQKMSSTIDDFREFFRPDHETARFNLVDSVREALNLVDASFHNNRVEVAVEPAPDIFVEGYPNEYSQVLLNVLTNAKDALVAREGDGKVRIAIERDGNMGVVRIRDNGGGIAEEILPKIFDPYFSTKEQGTGIGLYMSRMIVAHMDGQIAARNLEDGAEFVISVPLAPSQ
jgi:signal transduction histidine kinase